MAETDSADLIWTKQRRLTSPLAPSVNLSSVLFFKALKRVKLIKQRIPYEHTEILMFT